jgi:hypothetical protein
MTSYEWYFYKKYGYVRHFDAPDDDGPPTIVDYVLAYLLRIGFFMILVVLGWCFLLAIIQAL